MTDTSYETPRGFAGYAQLEDTYGARVRVQESSAASRRAVWIFTEGGAVASGDKPNDGSAHLDEAQARQVRDALTAFLGDDPLEAAALRVEELATDMREGNGWEDEWSSREIRDAVLHAADVVRQGAAR
ncbi:hypothetical protein ABRQ22_14725 [Cellulosimicrobium sp. ES-005]|uniref:Uncharacterized protein n=1 Tax=Cellulosimicrobium sp. ES-005 TaxID=3163031 RepID=A0AAU8FZR3_9MICO